MKIEKILFPTDFSPSSEQALDHALFLAKEFNAELHMLHAVVLHEDDPNDPKLHFSEFSELLKRLSAVASSELARLAAHPASDGITIVQTELRGYSAPAVILDHASDIDADLIVMGTHGRRGAGRFFLGSVAEKVVRHAPCPVLTLRERKEHHPLEAIHNVLVPVDFSGHSRYGLEAARELAALCKARLQIVHVVELRKLPTFYEPFSAIEITEDRKKRSKESLAKLAAKVAGPTVEEELHVLVEVDAAKALLDFATEHGSGLIVIPSHGLSGMERVLLGSTAERVIRFAGCPVLTVKPPADPEED
jgi:nucleotide-binding universal stress UspA family protein